MLPVGISFYTLQSLGYLIDVYRGETYAEKNCLKFALFISFFPQLVAGPIERSKNLLKQLATIQTFSYKNLKKGFLLILWGMFLKMVIADYAAIFVDVVYGDYHKYNGMYIVLATILFSIQIYCDFYGYSTIARGVALTMGYSLMENFNAPYFSNSVKEFWQRWHISLSTWFRDYLYIPLGGNRKGQIRQNINLMIVFAVSGLWHGATLAFAFWGLLNGFYQVMANIMRYIKKRIGIFRDLNERGLGKNLSIIATFVLISFAWLFFRAGGLGMATEILSNAIWPQNNHVLFRDFIYALGMPKGRLIVLVFSILALFLIDFRKYKGKDVAEELLAQHFCVRCLAEIVLIFMILLFGCYGEMYDAASFIYFQF